MTPCIQNRTIQFHDFTHGRFGYMVWFLPFSFLFFCWPLYMDISSLISTDCSWSENYMALCFAFIWFLALVIWMGSSILYALITCQSIKFEDSQIRVTLYYLRKLNINSNEIRKIDEFKVNRLMSQTRTFPKSGVGIKIYLKNGKKYLISPNMSEFDELKSILISV